MNAPVVTPANPAAPDAAPSALTRKDFASPVAIRWCPGCGDYSILTAVQGFPRHPDHRKHHGERNRRAPGDPRGREPDQARIQREIGASHQPGGILEQRLADRHRRQKQHPVHRDQVIAETEQIPCGKQGAAARAAADAAIERGEQWNEGEPGEPAERPVEKRGAREHAPQQRESPHGFRPARS
jgi:hypothetical protein